MWPIRVGRIARALWESESRAESYVAVLVAVVAALYAYLMYRREVKPELSDG